MAASRIVKDVLIVSNAYSYDLRRKVIEARELDGMKKSEASEVFHISRNTINLWLGRKACTGDDRAKRYQLEVGLKPRTSSTILSA